MHLAYCEYVQANKHSPPLDSDWLTEFSKLEPELPLEVAKAPDFRFNKVFRVKENLEDQTVFLYESKVDSQGKRVVMFYSGRDDKMAEPEFKRRYGTLLP